MSDRYTSQGPVLHLCTVLEEMRKCYRYRNFSSLPSLIEEAQFLGDRMENGLEFKADIKKMTEVKSELKKEIKTLKKKLKNLQGKLKDKE